VGGCRMMECQQDGYGLPPNEGIAPLGGGGPFPSFRTAVAPIFATLAPPLAAAFIPFPPPGGPIVRCFLAGPNSIFRMFCPNFNVEWVSLKFPLSGRMLTNMQVLESPPNDSCSTCVSLEFL
jgi:hypothetical protein